jgi:hypothetical protein
MTCIADANVIFRCWHAAHGAATEWRQNQSDAAACTCLLPSSELAELWPQSPGALTCSSVPALEIGMHFVPPP